MSRLSGRSQRVLTALRTALPLLTDPADLLLAEGLLALLPAYRLVSEALDDNERGLASAVAFVKGNLLAAAPNPGVRVGVQQFFSAVDVIANNLGAPKEPPGATHWQAPLDGAPSDGSAAPPPAGRRVSGPDRSDASASALADAYNLHLPSDTPPMPAEGPPSVAATDAYLRWSRRGMIYLRTPDGYKASPEVRMPDGMPPRYSTFPFDEPGQSDVVILLPGVVETPTVTTTDDGHVDVTATVQHQQPGLAPLRYAFSTDLPHGAALGRVIFKRGSGHADPPTLTLTRQTRAQQPVAVGVQAPGANAAGAADDVVPGSLASPAAPPPATRAPDVTPE